MCQDENGEEVDLIEKDHKGAESVTKEILKKWLTSDAPTRTYQHLIECLRQSELGALAEQLNRYAVVNIAVHVLYPLTHSLSLTLSHTLSLSLPPSQLKLLSSRAPHCDPYQ